MINRCIIRGTLDNVVWTAKVSQRSWIRVLCETLICWRFVQDSFWYWREVITQLKLIYKSMNILVCVTQLSHIPTERKRLIFNAMPFQIFLELIHTEFDFGLISDLPKVASLISYPRSWISQILCLSYCEFFPAHFLCDVLENVLPGVSAVLVAI